VAMPPLAPSMGIGAVVALIPCRHDEGDHALPFPSRECKDAYSPGSCGRVW
jgi:hypothetical protein